ncbi:MAG: hypothetical protein ACFBSE_14690 [Prochloraceae cyanobacterium]
MNINNINSILKPRHNHINKYTINISNDQGEIHETDIYYPFLDKLNIEKLPIVLFLQGALVDKSDYSNYANILSKYGFIVVIPNRKRFIPEVNMEGLFGDVGIIDDILKHLKNIEKDDYNSPINKIIDTSKLVLAGHSWGGSVGLSAINNVFMPILYINDFQKPDELKAAVFFETTLPKLDKNFQPTENFISINNKNISIAILESSLNQENSKARRKTYDSIKNGDKIFITIQGTNHYGITNEDNIERRKVVPFLEQKIATETIARWSALFLRATVLDDKSAKEYIFKIDNISDTNVIVKDFSIKKLD